MPFPRQTFTSLEQAGIQDIVSTGVTGGAVPLPKSNLLILNTTQAMFAYSLYGYLDWISKQSTPFTATDEYLEGWGALKNVFRKPATVSYGPLTVSGSPTATIPVGTVFSRQSDGSQYESTAAATLANGSATVSLEAVQTGSAPSVSVGDVLTLQTPIGGVNSSNTVTVAWAIGADQEIDSALRTRTLQAYQYPPQGGAVRDYIGWALSCPGVTRAWAAGGSNAIVTVFVMLDDGPPARQGFPQGANGVSEFETRAGFSTASGDQLAVADFLYSIRPVSAIPFVAAANAQPVNFVVGGLSANDEATTAAIEAALNAVFIANSTPLGGTIYPSAFNAALLSAIGDGDYWFESPLYPITSTIGNLPVLGTVTPA